MLMGDSEVSRASSQHDARRPRSDEAVGGMPMMMRFDHREKEREFRTGNDSKK